MSLHGQGGFLEIVDHLISSVELIIDGAQELFLHESETPCRDAAKKREPGDELVCAVLPKFDGD